MGILVWQSGKRSSENGFQTTFGLSGKRVVDDYANSVFKDGDLKILKDACQSYLNEEMNNFQECIYKVRNALFHNLRLHDESRDGHLKLIVDELMKIIPDILFSYKKPNFQKPDFK